VAVKRKAPARRKGYAEGGEVRQYNYMASDEKAPSSGAGITRALDRAGRTPENMATYKRAQKAMDSAYGNEYTDAPGERVDPLARADYPGFRKGGKVKKTMPVKKGRR